MPGDAGLGSTRASAQACSGHGYVVPPVAQLRWPVTWEPSSRVRLANEAQDGPWSAPSTLACCQMTASISAGVFRSAIRRKCRATLTIADRSRASSLGVAWADFSSASKVIGRPAGEIRSAGEPGTNERPVTTPPALRLTSAVACCHRGLAAGRHWYTPLRVMRGWGRHGGGWGPRSRHPRGGQGPEDCPDARVTGVVRVLEEHRRVLGGPRRRADHPLPEHIGDEVALAGPGCDGLRAQGRVAVPRRYRGRPGVPGAVRRHALQARLNHRLAVRGGQGRAADDVVDRPPGHLPPFPWIG